MEHILNGHREFDPPGIALTIGDFLFQPRFNPFVVFTNYDEKPGALVVEPHDFGWKGGPPMPARYQPWLQGSPYARCARS